MSLTIKNPSGLALVVMVGLSSFSTALKATSPAQYGTHAHLLSLRTSRWSQCSPPQHQVPQRGTQAHLSSFRLHTLTPLQAPFHFSLDLYFMSQIFLNHLQVHDETLSQIYKISEPPQPGSVALPLTISTADSTRNNTVSPKSRVRRKINFRPSYLLISFA